MSDYILKVEAINKSFRQHQVVKNISFEVRKRRDPWPAWTKWCWENNSDQDDHGNIPA